MPATSARSDYVYVMERLEGKAAKLREEAEALDVEVARWKARKIGDRLATAVTKADRAFGWDWKGADCESWINLIAVVLAPPYPEKFKSRYCQATLPYIKH